MRRGVAAVAALLVLGLVQTAPADAKVILQTQVFPKEKGKPIPRSFLGFSIEWSAILGLTGQGATGVNGVYRQFMSNLAAYGGGMPALRVGGNSEDTAWWNPENKPLPFERGIYVNIRPITLRNLAMHVQTTGQRVLLGVNLVANDPKLAAAEVKAFREYIPRKYLLGLEIGNEPDSYLTTTTLEKRNSKGRVIERRYARKRPWNGRKYMRQWDRIARAVLHAYPHAPLVGTGGYGVLVKPKTFIGRNRKRLAFYTEHAYPLTGCAAKGRQYKPGQKGYPTLQRLLGHDGAFTTIAQERRGIQAAHHFHKRYVVDEMGAVACTSRPVVSRSFGTALWGLDYLFLQAGMGVDGVNFHIGSLDKSPFRFFPVGPGAGFTGFADPTYWSMLAFAHAAGRKSRILIGPTLAEHAPRGTRKPVNVRVWAVRNGKQLRIFVINKDLKRGGTVQIKVPHGTATGALARFKGRSVSSREGISFGGQTIASPTPDGVLQGTFQTSPVAPKRGVYSVTVPRASAALLTIG